LSANQISSIANGTFAGLTALPELYDGAVGWADFFACLLVFAWI
jgi:hypothetical protein